MHGFYFFFHLRGKITEFSLTETEGIFLNHEGTLGNQEGMHDYLILNGSYQEMRLTFLNKGYCYLVNFQLRLLNF